MQPHPTPRELEALAAWAEIGSVVGAARYLGTSEQRVKNLLFGLRLRIRAASNVEAFRLLQNDLPAARPASHNVQRQAPDGGISG